MSRIAKAAVVIAGTGAIMAGGVGMATADAGAQGVAAHSPGVLSGNLVQVPIHIPINICGNTVNVIGLLNPAFGNTCVNSSSHDKHYDKHHDGYGG
ncbi:chaplin [Streptomyces sp. H27-C3]|uniref:chaplin n=1 Tax=Streptomyces sp. H27-C3 TaxID=3046305 RepID=UPI0024BA1B1E|nr:chaplin [Streptomyces sp. H27-C3]MDJ0460243.1 chaplin [Streptomyces sp. H27-C3]